MDVEIPEAPLKYAPDVILDRRSEKRKEIGFRAAWMQITAEMHQNRRVENVQARLLLL